MILESLAKEFIQGIVQMAHLCSAISGVSVGVAQMAGAWFREGHVSVLALGWMTRTVRVLLAALNHCDLANPNSRRKLHKAAFTRLPNFLELCHL